MAKLMDQKEYGWKLLISPSLDDIFTNLNVLYYNH